MRNDSHPGQIDFLPMPEAPHPRIGWAFTCRAGGFSQGAWGAWTAPDAAERNQRGNTPADSDAPSVNPPPTPDSASTPEASAVLTQPGGDTERAEPTGPGLNLGALCGDDPQAVGQNRALLASAIGRPISWLRQVHGNHVFTADQLAQDGVQPPPVPDPRQEPEADAQITTQAGIALAVLVADCLPVLLADRQGRVVGAAHAGWRGLLDGVLEATVQQMKNRVPDADISAWLGPCIGPTAFEVGEEVRDAFTSRDPAAESAFIPGQNPGKWLANLPMLARQRLARAGISHILDSGECTHSHPDRYWSFRRDRTCGRMAGVVWTR